MEEPAAKRSKLEPRSRPLTRQAVKSAKKGKKNICQKELEAHPLQIERSPVGVGSHIKGHSSSGLMNTNARDAGVIEMLESGGSEIFRDLVIDVPDTLHTNKGECSSGTADNEIVISLNGGGAEFKTNNVIKRSIMTLQRYCKQTHSCYTA